MKSAPVRKKIGRPLALVADAKTLKTVEGLGKIQATIRECAAVLDVSHQTFITFMNANPAVGEALERGKEGGKTSLRRTQFALAKKNAAMAIFLGKNYLDQTDRQDISQSVTVDVTVTDARSKLERLLLRQHGAGADKPGPDRPH